MIGTYRFIQNGEVIAESSNLITTAGKKALLDYAARFTKQLVGSLVVGIGSATAVVGDKKLGFEVARASVMNNSVDYPNSAVVYKAQIPQDLAVTIYEVGALTSDAVSMQDFGSKLVLDFNETYDSWSTGAWIPNFSRLGNALRLTPSTSTTASSVLSNVFLDFYGYSDADQFSFAYRAGNSFIANVTFRFRTDASNYYSTTITSPASGVYTITTVNKSAMVATGSPDWSNITSVEVTATATSGGAGVFDFDAVRIDDTDANREENVLFSRSVLGSPVVKTADLPLDIEYAVTF